VEELLIKKYMNEKDKSSKYELVLKLIIQELKRTAFLKIKTIFSKLNLPLSKTKVLNKRVSMMIHPESNQNIWIL
jgi:hypothetical protein